MKSFKNYINRMETLIENITINEKIKMSDFIKAVNSHSSLDDALENLPDEYIEFYLKNMNSKKLKSELQKLKLTEDKDYEIKQQQTLKTSPDSDKYKKIHYKGEFIILRYDERWGWVPQMAFRSITQASKFIKNIVDTFD